MSTERELLQRARDALRNGPSYMRSLGIIADIDAHLKEPVQDERKVLAGNIKQLIASAWAFNSSPSTRYKEICDGIDLLAALPQPAVVPDSTIREVFLRNGFTIKDGQTDLKPYVYASARELLAIAATPPNGDKP